MSFDISLCPRFVVEAITDMAAQIHFVGGQDAFPPGGISGA